MHDVFHDIVETLEACVNGFFVNFARNKVVMHTIGREQQQVAWLEFDDRDANIRFGIAAEARPKFSPVLELRVHGNRASRKQSIKLFLRFDVRKRLLVEPLSFFVT